MRYTSLTGSIAKAGRQLRFATAVALTRTAQDVQAEMERALPQRLDRPTAFTRRAFSIVRATRSDLRAEVFVRPIQSRYLGLQERGGTRRPRGRALVVPVGARLNAYGNLPRGAVQRLLTRKDVFSGTIKGVAGIWQRTRRGGVKLLIAYEPKADYSPRLDFETTARAVVTARYRLNLRREIARAIATAR